MPLFLNHSHRGGKILAGVFTLDSHGHMASKKTIRHYGEWKRRRKMMNRRMEEKENGGGEWRRRRMEEKENEGGWRRMEENEENVFSLNRHCPRNKREWLKLLCHITRGYEVITVTDQRPLATNSLWWSRSCECGYPRVYGNMTKSRLHWFGIAFLLVQIVWRLK